MLPVNSGIRVRRFFFHFSDGRRRLTDGTGREFASIRAARAHAVSTLREARAALCERELRDLSGWSLSVTDAQGRLVFALGFDLRPHEGVPLAPEHGEAVDAKNFFGVADENLSPPGAAPTSRAAAEEPISLSGERVERRAARPERAPGSREKKF